MPVRLLCVQSTSWSTTVRTASITTSTDPALTALGTARTRQAHTAASMVPLSSSFGHVTSFGRVNADPAVGHSSTHAMSTAEDVCVASCLARPECNFVAFAYDAATNHTTCHQTTTCYGRQEHDTSPGSDTVPGNSLWTKKRKAVRTTILPRSHRSSPGHSVGWSCTAH